MSSRDRGVLDLNLMISPCQEADVMFVLCLVESGLHQCSGHQLGYPGMRLAPAPGPCVKVKGHLVTITVHATVDQVVAMVTRETTCMLERYMIIAHVCGGL